MISPLVLECITNSTAHGLPHVAAEKKRSLQILWSILVFLCFGILSYHTYTLLLQLASKPTSVNFIADGTPFVAPDIILCNKQILAQSYIKDERTTIRPFGKVLNIDQFIRFTSLNRTFTGLIIWQTVPIYSMYESIGHRQYQSIVTSWRAVLEPLEIIPHWKHLNCYRYQPKNMNMFEIQNKLSLILYGDVEPANIPIGTSVGFIGNPFNTYIPSLQFDGDVEFDKESGFVVYLVPHGEYPHLDSISAEASSGFKTELSIAMTKTELDPDGNTNCKQNQPDVEYINILKENETITFKASVWDCVYDMFHKSSMEKCGCLTHIYPISIEHVKYTGGKPRFCFNIDELDANLTDNWQYLTPFTNLMKLRYTCLLRVKAQMPEFGYICSNKMRLCNSITYSFTKKNTVWPLKTKYYEVFGDVIDAAIQFKISVDNTSVMPGLEETRTVYRSRDTYPANELGRLFESNFLKVVLKSSQMYSTLIKENLSYTIKNFVSDFGGILGFYLGLSVLTLCEIFDIFVRTILLFNAYNKNSVDPQKNTKNSCKSTQLENA